MAKIVRVSFNQSSEKAMAEVKAYKDQGYVEIDTYGDGIDMGQRLEYAQGDDREEVLARHEKHKQCCNLTHIKLSSMTK